MCECSHYREERDKLTGHEVTTNRHPRNYALVILYCAHPTLSPWDRTMAKKKPEGYLNLKCDGLLSNCPLTDEQRNGV